MNSGGKTASHFSLVNPNLSYEFIHRHDLTLAFHCTGERFE